MISAFIPKVSVVTDGEWSQGVVTVAGGKDDGSGGMVVREGGEEY